MIRRPFVIEQPIPATPGKDSTIELHHENQAISLTVTHGIFGEPVNVLLDPAVARDVRDAIDVLLMETAARLEYAVENM